VIERATALLRSKDAGIICACWRDVWTAATVIQPLNYHSISRSEAVIARRGRSSYENERSKKAQSIEKVYMLFVFGCRIMLIPEIP
jgi:hypothetical protein